MSGLSAWQSFANSDSILCSTNLPDGQITQKSVKPLWQKYSDFPKLQISLYSSRPVLLRGTFANVTNVGAGCGGRSGARDGRCSLRTVKSCGPDTSTLVSSLR